MPRGMGGVNSFLERVNPFYIVHFELAWNSRERIPKVYENLKKVSVSVSILRPMAVSVSVSNSKLEKKSLNLGLEVETLKKSLGLSLVVETTRKKSQSRSRNWDSMKVNLDLGLETVNPVSLISGWSTTVENVPFLPLFGKIAAKLHLLRYIK